MHCRKCWDVMQNKVDSCSGRTRRPECSLKYLAVTKRSPDRSGLAAESNGARALFLSFGSWRRGSAVLEVLRGLREAGDGMLEGFQGAIMYRVVQNVLIRSQ